MDCRTATIPRRARLDRGACLAALLAASAFAQPGAGGQTPKADTGPWPLSHVSVWLTPMQYDPVPTLRWLDQQKLQPDRVIVQALDCGMTAFATKSAVLACAPNVAGKDPIGDVGEWAHARGIECWAALDTVLGRCYSLAHRPWTKSVFRKAESGEGEAPQTRRA